MNLSYRDINMVVCSGEAMLGVVLVIAALRFLSLFSEDPISYGIAGAALFIVGLGCLLFGWETYVLRDDDDICR